MTMYTCTACNSQYTSPLAAAECSDIDAAEERRIMQLRVSRR